MINGLRAGLLALTLMLAAVTDWRRGKVYNWLVYPAILAGLAIAVIEGLRASPEHLHGEPGVGPAVGAAILAGLAGFVPFLIIFLLGGVGGGDAKLMGAVGVISASWRCVLDTAVYALIINLLIALAVMWRRGIFRKTLRNVLGAVLMLPAARGKNDAETRRRGDAATVNPATESMESGGPAGTSDDADRSNGSRADAVQSPRHRVAASPRHDADGSGGVENAPAPRLPFAVAIAAGGMIALADHLLGLPWPWSKWLG